MKPIIILVLRKLWWLITTMLSESGDISAARSFTAYLILYFSAQDAWFFHRNGHLVDNATLLTQLSVMTAFYITNKTVTAFTSKSDPPKE